MMTRKQNCCLFLVLILLTGILLSACSGSDVQLSEDQTASYQTGSDDDWEVIEAGSVHLENDQIAFDFNVSTTHFTVTERKSGLVYRSVPESVDAGISEEVQARMTSEITAIYYDSDSNRLYMTSDKDSVSHEMVTVKKKDSTLRVYYTLGNTTSRLLAPKVFTQDFFENDLCTADCFSSSQIRRLKRYYDLYTPEEPGEDYQAMKELYPILASQALYIIKDTVDDLNLIEIDEYMQLYGYTQEQYQQDLAVLNISEGQSDDAEFVIPVEYSLEADGFSARILMDKVAEASEQFTLQQIAFLEYFGSTGSEGNGYFLVPDGSGALISLNQGGTAYEQRIYGADLTKDKQALSNLEQHACLPVFGTSFGDHGLFAVIENAEESAEIFAETVSESSPQNHIYAAFHVREMDVTDIGADRDILSFNLYSKQRLAESPKVRYVCLSGETVGYSDMAAYYRQYLEEKNLLVKRDTSSGLLLNYWGIAVEEASFLGIPYDDRMVLSKLTDISDDLKKMSESGILDATVRLQGYSDSGLTHQLNNRFSLSGKVGSTDELLALKQQLSGGNLYLEADFQVVYDDGWFDKFSAKADSARSLSRKVAVVKSHDLVNREFVGGKLNRYLVSPTRFTDIVSDFLDSLNQKLPGQTDIGVSYQSAGSLLTGDYSAANGSDRVKTAEYICENIERVSASRPVLSDVGNLYAVSVLSRIDNLPMCSSEYDVSAESVPFYQMVIHGYIPYSGVPVNLSADPETACLKAVEYGAGLSFILCTGDEIQLSSTEYGQYYYSLSSKQQLSKVIERYNNMKDVYSAVAASRFASHEQLSERVYCSRFENGVQIIVNYNQESVTVDGKNIPAKGFVMLQGGNTTEGTV